MALPTNAFPTYSGIGRREDLSDEIAIVAPLKTPFISSIRVKDAKQTLFEWQTDTIDAAISTNQQLEGDDYTASAVTATVRRSNTCEISTKVPRVTGTERVVSTAGREDELEYQIAKFFLALKRDVETSALKNTIEATGNSTTARVTGGLPTWLTSNDSRGVGGVEGGTGDTAATDAGTARPFTETLLQDVHQLCYVSGADPSLLMLGAYNKRAMSSFTGNATRMKSAEDKRLIAAIDIYDGDFGELAVVPNLFQRARDAYLIDPEYAAFCSLRPWQMEELSKTGDSDMMLLLVEWGLEVTNQAAHGVVADLTTG